MSMFLRDKAIRICLKEKIAERSSYPIFFFVSIFILQIYTMQTVLFFYTFVQISFFYKYIQYQLSYLLLLLYILTRQEIVLFSTSNLCNGNYCHYYHFKQFNHYSSQKASALFPKSNIDAYSKSFISFNFFVFFQTTHKITGYHLQKQQ